MHAPLRVDAWCKFHFAEAFSKRSTAKYIFVVEKSFPCLFRIFNVFEIPTTNAVGLVDHLYVIRLDQSGGYPVAIGISHQRSEERRVGKEGKSRGRACDYKKKHER